MNVNSYSVNSENERCAYRLEWRLMAVSCLMHRSITARWCKAMLNGKNRPTAALRRSLLEWLLWETYRTDDEKVM